MNNESRWIPISGYEGYYELSLTGRVRSLSRTIFTKKGLRSVKGKLLSPKSNGSGYLFVVLCKKGNKACQYLHRLVARGFIPNPYNKPQVNHINGDKTDNRVVNLEWVTAQENSCHAHRKGLYYNIAELKRLITECFCTAFNAVCTTI